jgi:hypothetical protein
MYKFKSGKFEGKTMELAILRSAPRLYWTMARLKEKVNDQPRLEPLLQEFKRLRRLLRDAPVRVGCQRKNCKRPVTRMSFQLDAVDLSLLPGALYWCHRHDPSQYPEWEEEERPILPLHFDAIRGSAYRDKNSQKAIHLAVLEGLGIDNKPAGIAEAFARRYFAKLS